MQMFLQAHVLNTYSANGAAIEGGWGTLGMAGAWVPRGGPLKVVSGTWFLF